MGEEEAVFILYFHSVAVLRLSRERHCYDTKECIYPELLYILLSVMRCIWTRVQGVLCAALVCVTCMYPRLYIYPLYVPYPPPSSLMGFFFFPQLTCYDTKNSSNVEDHGSEGDRLPEDLVVHCRRRETV